jgi:hypothetical protein
MPQVAKQTSHSLPAEDVAHLEDYRKEYLEGVRQLTIRAQTTDHTGTLPLYAYQKPVAEPKLVDFKALFGEPNALEKVMLYAKGTILIFVERGVTKCGVVQEHCYEGDQEVCLTVYEPNEQNMLMLDPSVRKDVDIDRLRYGLDGHMKADKDHLILSEEQYHEIYGCNPLDNENKNDAEDDEIEPVGSASNLKTQTVGEKRGRTRKTKIPRHFDDFI